MLERVGRPVAHVQSGDAERFRPGIALIVEVVDRVDGARVAKVVAGAQSGMEIDRQQRRVPIVSVKNVGRDAEKTAAFDDGATEKRETLQVVVKAVDARRVNLFAIEVVVVGDEDQRNVASRQRRSQVARFRRPVRPRQTDGANNFRLDVVAHEPIACLPIVRRDNDNVMTEFRKRLGE